MTPYLEPKFDGEFRKEREHLKRFALSMGVLAADCFLWRAVRHRKKQILSICAEGLLGKTGRLLVVGSGLSWTRSVVKLPKCALKLLCGSCEL
jgi:hypothetical protein